MPGLRFAAPVIRAAANAALTAQGIAEPCEISVLITDGEGIRELNRLYRNINSATDVLSFPQNAIAAGEFNAPDLERSPETGGILLGDMAINLPRCRAQGDELGHGWKRELLYLTIHSVLHLLGYDHTDEGEQKKLMRGREKEILLTLQPPRAVAKKVPHK